MVAIASRSSWGARHPDGAANLTGVATGVFLHHSVTATLAHNATVAAEQHQMRTLEQIGQARFRSGISYNLVTFPSGRPYQGTSWNRRGTHTGGHNTTARGLCFAGNFETNRPTDAAIRAMAAVVETGRGRWWTPSVTVRPHQAVSSTACPGRHIIARINEIRAGGSGTPQPPAPPPPIPRPPSEELTMDAEARRRFDQLQQMIGSAGSAVNVVLRRVDALARRVDEIEAQNPPRWRRTWRGQNVAAGRTVVPRTDPGQNGVDL